MNIDISTSTIERFFAEIGSDDFLKTQSQTHIRRSTNAKRILQIDHLAAVSKIELQEFLKDTDAWLGVRSGDQFWKRLFGEADERLPILRDIVKELVAKAEYGLDAKGVKDFLEKLPGIGPAFLSEIMTLRFPDKYWMWNGPVRNFLKSQKIDIKSELPRGKKGDQGEEYMLAGKYLSDVRKILSQQSDNPVSFLVTDLFLYWASRERNTVDPWAERIALWVSELDSKRLEVRLEGELRARQRLEARLGNFTEDDLRSFAKDLSSDWHKNSPNYTRFRPAFFGPQVNLLVESLAAFNVWAKKIWNSSEDQLNDVLNELWSSKAVNGGGITFPTAVLYLKNPAAYSIWLENTTKGLQRLSNFEPGMGRTAEGYRTYNQAILDFRTRYKLQPHIVDVILWRINSSETESQTDSFTGFVPDTFIFLKELNENNNDDWMHANDNANLDRYRKVLQEPLRSLFAAVAPSITQMDPGLETEAKVHKVLATIRRRFPTEQGPYHSHHWGAYYRKGRTKQTDCQLFIIVYFDHVNVGLSVAGSQGSDIAKLFRKNLSTYPELFLKLLCRLSPGFHIRVLKDGAWVEKSVESFLSSADLTALSESEDINIEMSFPQSDPILYHTEFVTKVQKIFLDLYPLYRFTIGNDDIIETLVKAEAEGKEDVEEEIELEERYSIEMLTKETYLPVEFFSKIEFLLKTKQQIIFYGPPGTGKTWVAEKFATYWVEQAKELGGQVKIVQFHPSYSYEEFVEGIRPETFESPDGQKQITYPVRPGIFRRLCDEARQYTDRRYVLIIDEINRGELPRIFGELLYLLEYRKKSVVLPYSAQQGEFGIPGNVYLIGTMNTADRSIALIDHALRRRFYFIPMKADAELLRSFLVDKLDGMEWVADLLMVLNKKLEQEAKIDWALHIGHSHFMKEDLNDDDLRIIWEHSVMPTLEEYFYRKGDSYLNTFSLDSLKAELSKG